VGTQYLLPISIASGFAAGSSQPVAAALVTAAVPPEQRRVGIAITRAAFNAGIVIGPPLGALAAAAALALTARSAAGVVTPEPG
jgi:MFS family permease